MHIIQQSFKVSYNYPVIFTENMFDLQNESLKICFGNNYNINTKIIFAIDTTFLSNNIGLFDKIKKYFNFHLSAFKIIDKWIEIDGGESAKNDSNIVDTILENVHLHAIDRHSYICVLGGGSVIDTVGFAAALAHRGIRLVRIPTTTLSQNDAAIGVKNSINAYKKKNFTGTFAPPFAVINDFNFLYTLSDRDWRCGIAEAIKVALIKDISFFENIKNDATLLANRNMPVMQKLIIRCADLHLQHIASGDAFEQGSARPLDFGHWAAHKLEYLTYFELKHGEAVAIGIAIDSVYSYLINNITKSELLQILDTLIQVGFDIFNPHLLHKDSKDNYLIINGLEEFREHLGGQLCVTILASIGKGIEVQSLDKKTLIDSINFLKNYKNK